MTPGKAAAQVAHAASQAAYKMYRLSEDNPLLLEYEKWECDPDYNGPRDDEDAGFGTTIVLDGGSFESVAAAACFELPSLIGQVFDSSYPVRDGKITHYLDIFTCFWIFADSDDAAFTEFRKKYKLYEGNHD